MNELYHYNKNHDRLGRFASGHGGNLNRVVNSAYRKHMVNKALTPEKKGKASPAEKMARETGNAINAARSLNKGRKKSVDLSNMSDAELRAAINRLNMERQYADLTGANITRGQQNLDRTLELAGSVVTIGASAAGIASAIYLIKHGK